MYILTGFQWHATTISINLNILERRGETLTWPDDVFDRDRVIFLYRHLQYNETPICLINAAITWARSINLWLGAIREFWSRLQVAVVNAPPPTPVVMIDSSALTDTGGRTPNTHWDALDLLCPNALFGEIFRMLVHHHHSVWQLPNDNKGFLCRFHKN